MRNRVLRAVVALVGASFVITSLPGVPLPSFLGHLGYFLSGGILETVVTGNWLFVGINVAIFLAFAWFLRVRSSIDWNQREGLGIYAAFIVSLFVEMYGIPLSLYLGSGIVGGAGGQGAGQPALWQGVILGQQLSMTAWMIVGLGITVLGMGLVAVGWWQVYTADGLRTDGLYAYSRNPQYAGIVLIAFGWVIGFPTLLTIALFPLLVVAYYRAARREAGDLRDRYGERYERYAARVPLVV